MDEQRLQAYVALIEQLLTCPQSGEMELLQAQAELVDEGLLAVMQQYADWLEQQGSSNAGWLRRFAQGLRAAMENSNVQTGETPEEAKQFLLTVLELVLYSQGNAQQVYPFLAQHQERLNETLLQNFPQIAAALLSSDSEQIAAVLVSFGNLINQFPLGQHWLNLELGIAAYQQALTVRTQTAMPVEWARTKMNLANAYRFRIRGDKAENIELAIQFYKQVLTVMARTAMPVEWAATMHNLAMAHRNRIRGDRAENIELAIQFYEQALTVRTKTAMPIDWAGTMNNLAVAYSDRIRGDRAENIELVIRCCEQALTVMTQATMPIEWAGTMNNLADAYSNRIRGDRAENIELAIQCCEQALTVMTQTAMPVDWATTMLNLANAYSNRIRGDRAENIELAIELYQQALMVRTRTAMPIEWAQTMNNLANAYSDRIRGDRAENIEQAIQCCEQALTVMTQTAMPVNWATAMAQLATAYSERIRGDRAENIELAIEFYQQALTVRTRTAMPVEWAMTTNNLAIAYVKRIRGDRAENIEQAIQTYQQVLTVSTQTALPTNWADTMMELANAYYFRIRGDRAKNIELAIEAYQQALTVMTQSAMPVRWAETMMNLANAYDSRIQGDRSENIELAIEAYQQALTVMTQSAMPVGWAKTMMNLALAYDSRIQGDRSENIELAIGTYQQALTVRTQTAMPVEWAHTMMNLATAYFDRIRGDRAENIELAIGAYQDSLKIFVPELLPDYCRKTARSLANLYAEQKCWTEAVSIYQKALQAAELLYQSANLLDSKAAELAATADLPRRAAYAFARVGQLEQAVLTLEQGRARGLSETLDRDRSNLIQLRENHPKLFTQYQDITQQLRNLEAQQRQSMTAEERQSVTPEVLRNEAQRLRQTLTETIEQIRQVEGYADFLAQPDFDDIRQAVHPEIPLVYLVSTPVGSLALIVTQDKTTELWLDDLTETNLIDLLNNIWFKAYSQAQTNYQAWLDAIAQVTGQLWEPLMAPLVDHLKQHQFQQATLIPTGYLSLLPLHAAWTEDPAMPTGKRYALDEILFTYAPNARSSNAAAEIARQTDADAILAIDNPLKDLPNSSREVTAAVASFAQPHILQHEAATSASVLAALPDCNVLHLSCHGTANLEEPLNSGLAMSNGLLTLRDLLDLKLSEQGGIRLAVLSACETGLAGTELADEAISLPTGLLQAGVAGVVASLWSVSDLSTMLLLVRFYDLWRNQNLPPAVALRQAQQWLRDSTEGELADYFGLLTPTPDKRTYAHPFHWAAFSYTGV